MCSGMEAVSNGSLFQIIIDLLKNGADFTKCGYDDFLNAIPNSSVMRLFREKFYNPLIEDTELHSFKDQVLRKDEVAILYHLRTGKVSPNDQASNGVPLINYACRNNMLKLLKGLCERGAFVNGENIDKEAGNLDPLTTCASYGLLEPMKILLALPKIKVDNAQDGKTALWKAIK